MRRIPAQPIQCEGNSARIEPPRHQIAGTSRVEAADSIPPRGSARPGECGAWAGLTRGSPEHFTSGTSLCPSEVECPRTTCRQRRRRYPHLAAGSHRGPHTHGNSPAVRGRDVSRWPMTDVPASMHGERTDDARMAPGVWSSVPWRRRRRATPVPVTRRAGRQTPPRRSGHSPSACRSDRLATV